MRSRGRSVCEAKGKLDGEREWGALGAIYVSLPVCALFWLTLAAVLTSCNTTRPAVTPAKIETVKVGVAVRASCVPKDLAGPPAYVDTDAALAAAPGPGEALLLLGAGRKQRIARSGEVEPIIENCR